MSSLTAGVGVRAKRWRERQGWIIFGSIVAALCFVARGYAHSPTMRMGWAIGAGAVVGFALVRFNRGSLTATKK